MYELTGQHRSLLRYTSCILRSILNCELISHCKVYTYTLKHIRSWLLASFYYEAVTVWVLACGVQSEVRLWTRKFEEMSGEMESLKDVKKSAGELQKEIQSLINRNKVSS